MSQVSVLISAALMGMKNLHAILHFLNLGSEYRTGCVTLMRGVETVSVHKSGTQIHGHTASGVQKMPLLVKRPIQTRR